MITSSARACNSLLLLVGSPRQAREQAEPRRQRAIGDMPKLTIRASGHSAPAAGENALGYAATGASDATTGAGDAAVGAGAAREDSSVSERALRS
mmetsp:Transcript_5536/g.16411  ORF Transcript_5536/g.16411 Transcript_5536/m.16411 type:complete len:95 (-) Transcript_5536:1116-1400(-)